MDILNENIKKVPKYGLLLPLNHEYPERWTQGNTLTWGMIWAILPLVFRYLIDYFKQMWNKTIPCMDYIKIQHGKQIYGVPIGGIGTGSIGRGFRGEFCRFQLKPGVYEYNTVDANQFIVTIQDSTSKTIFQSLLSTFEKTGKSLSCWQSLLNGGQCKYTGLYPRAWTEYNLSEYGIKLVCRQVSPVIAHNYKDSSLPCAVFIWSIENNSNEERKVTIAFTFKNGTQNISKNKSVCSTKSYTYMDSTGVVLHNSIDNIPCAFALGAKASDDVQVSKCLHFDPNSSGEIPWKQLHENGKFDDLSEIEYEKECHDIACGIATQVVVKPKQVKESEICLVWDMPSFKFTRSSNVHHRFYTKYFGKSNATFKIVDYALKNYSTWERQIYDWQLPVLDDRELPDWYKATLFNETYFISDGGTIWCTLDDDEAEKIPISDPRQKYGRFAYLEGHEYRMYNTYDVHFYASFALIMNWPYLQLSLQYDMKDFIYMEIKTPMKMLYNGHSVKRKIKNSVPHDAGDPNENPFLLINAYPIHDVSEWRDLNVKFVLQVLRDYCIMENIDQVHRRQYLENMYEPCRIVMMKTLKFDSDGDCLIENGGNPDQTFDSWVMTGASAYCGGLWLAALYAMIQIAKELDKNQDADQFDVILVQAKHAFETKLWNGKYYNFDCSIKHATTVMADQLCGHWYLRSCGYTYEVFPKSNVFSALNTIYNNNVMSYYNGTRGAVNGFRLNEGIDMTSVQSEEVWTGVTYGLAACMIHEKLLANAWKTAGGMHNVLVVRIGMSFETPEALCAPQFYRSIGYMRPLSIWSMQLAWNQYKKDKST